jgi:hypothetical protein
LAAALVCSAAARRASAWEATQVTLQATVLSYQKTTVTFDGNGASSSSSASVTSFGLFGSGVGAGVGYQWDHVGLGVRANIQSASSGNQDATVVSFFPRLEYQVTPGESAPFIAGLVGLNHTSIGDRSSTTYGFGGSLGVHGFLDPAVSIDPELTVVGFTGSQTAGGADNYSQSGVQVLLTLGLSGWITGARKPAAAAPPVRETVPAPQPAAAPPAQNEGSQPLYTSIHLPGHRQLYLQVAEDPASTSLIVRLAEPRTEVSLVGCDEITVPSSSGPLRMRVLSRGDHFVAGRLPLRAAELLASTSDASLSVCGVQWSLGQESREVIQAFLSDRADLVGSAASHDADEPVQPSAPPAVPAPAPGALPPTPSTLPAQPTPAPTPPSAPTPPPAPKKK